MIAEEKDLERRFGKQQPFRVPDGYFDNLAANIMDKFPEELPAMTPVSYTHLTLPTTERV